MNFLSKSFQRMCLAALLYLPFNGWAQDMEWKLVNPVYVGTDPDGAGPATGIASFTLQIRAINAPIPGINAISTGWSYDSTKAMVPTTPGCTIVSNPANVALSSDFTNAGFAYTTVNQCGNFTQIAGSASLNKRVVGTLDGSGITIGTSFMDIFTVTMWALDSINKGGSFAINSGAGGFPEPFATYSAADDLAGEYIINSLSFSTPIALPVTFSSFNVTCKGNAALINWSTDMESNSSHFVIEKSMNGSSWTSIGTVKAAGYSNTRKNYQFNFPSKGNAIFRLKQVDLDGLFSYSKVAASNCGSNTRAVAIYPVPAHEKLKVSVNTEQTATTQFILLDATGKRLRVLNNILQAGNNTIDMDLTGLNPGTYLLQVINDLETVDIISFIKD
jgi:hypothetical protein